MAHDPRMALTLADIKRYYGQRKVLADLEKEHREMHARISKLVANTLYLRFLHLHLAQKDTNALGVSLRDYK